MAWHACFDGDDMNMAASVNASGDVKSPDNDEPLPVSEPDLPSDGHDKEGEEMIRDLPRNPGLSGPPSEPSQKSQAADS